MENEFESASLTAGQLNAIVKKLSGDNEALRFLRGELLISEAHRNWGEENGIIYLSVNSDGTRGPEWITRLEEKGFRVSKDAKSLLYSENFKPSSGLTIEIAILKERFFKERERTTKKIYAKAKNHQLGIPNVEVACLIREKFSDKEIKAMNLSWIVVMHEPINNPDKGLELLGANCYDNANSLDIRYGRPNAWWNECHGFAFVISEVKSSV